MTIAEKYIGGNKQSFVDALRNDWNSLYIGGEWLVRGNRSVIKDHDPYTEKIMAEVPSATTEDVNSAFDIAEKVQRENMHRTPQELAKPILEAITLLLENSDEILPILISESGSTVTKARFEIEQIAVPMMREAASFPR